jgi:outer membrane protein
MLYRFSNITKLIFILVSVHIYCVPSSYAGSDAANPEDYIGPAKSGLNADLWANESNSISIPTAEANTVSASSAASSPKQNNAIELSVTQAILLSLENNKSLFVQRFNPQILRTFEQEQQSVFDPVIDANISQSSTKAETTPRPGLGTFQSQSKNLYANVGVSQFFPTGTMLSLTGSTNKLTGSFLNQPFYTTRIGGTVTQPLLQGFGTTVNLASVEQAKIDTKASQYELRGFVENLVAQIEETYWDYALAQRQIEIVNQSLEIAQKQLDETKERISLGSLARSELTTAEAELALRNEDLINARSTLAKTKLSLLQLINPPGANLWNKEVILQSAPSNPTEQPQDVEMHVAIAMQMRPELNQAKLQWQRDKLEVVKTKNGLLPQLDLFITLGRTGYANSFGQSVKNISSSRDDYDIMGGVSFEYYPHNRGAEARNLRAVATREQARESIDNLSQTVEVDVRNAYLEIIRSREQVAATAASRKLQEEKLRIETEKFRVGKSTALLVAQAERDFLSSRIVEVQALVGYIKAFVELYRLDGTLLERRGIASPGREAVKLPDITVR